MSRELIATTGKLLRFGMPSLAERVSSMVPDDAGREDSGITSLVQSSLEANEKVKARQVEVETRGGVVSLTGVVGTTEARREAGRIAWRTDGVEGVLNDLTVDETMIDSRVDDIVIASKVKSKLVGRAEI